MDVELALYGGAIGAVGSLAYFTALLFRFVGNDQLVAKFWPDKDGWLKKVARAGWFALVGAAVAFVFQLPQDTLAPIQGFIVGTTWPTIVAQVLTGRQGQSPDEISQQVSKLLVTPSNR